MRITLRFPSEIFQCVWVTVELNRWGSQFRKCSKPPGLCWEHTFTCVDSHQCLGTGSRHSHLTELKPSRSMIARSLTLSLTSPHIIAATIPLLMDLAQHSDTWGQSISSEFQSYCILIQTNLSVYLSVHLSIYLPISIHLSIYHLSVCLYPSIISLSIYICMYVCIYLLIYHLFRQLSSVTSSHSNWYMTARMRTSEFRLGVVK